MQMIRIAVLTAVLLTALMVFVASVFAEDEQADEPALYVVEFSPGPGWIEGKSVFEQPLLDHAKYHKGLFDAGKLYLGGPYLDDSGGLVIFRAYSVEEVTELLNGDPAVFDGIFTGEIHEYYAVFNAPEGYGWDPPAEETAPE